jgi:hypothetical protein
VSLYTSSSPCRHSFTQILCITAEGIRGVTGVQVGTGKGLVIGEYGTLEESLERLNCYY